MKLPLRYRQGQRLIRRFGFAHNYKAVRDAQVSRVLVVQLPVVFPVMNGTFLGDAHRWFNGGFVNELDIGEQCFSPVESKSYQPITHRIILS